MKKSTLIKLGAFAESFGRLATSVREANESIERLNNGFSEFKDQKKVLYNEPSRFISKPRNNFRKR